MALCTIDKTDESFAIQRLEKSGLEYEICPINAHRLNLFLGKKECNCLRTPTDENVCLADSEIL